MDVEIILDLYLNLLRRASLGKVRICPLYREIQFAFQMKAFVRQYKRFSAD